MSVVEGNKTDRILIVDDTEDNLILVQTLLEHEGYETDLVTDGISALDNVVRNPPDLILLDVMMPGMDGYEVTRRIRGCPNLTYIPILLITASDKSSVVVGLDAGADDFIRKPFDTDELLARVRSLLRLKHSIDAQEKMTHQREDFVYLLTHDLRTPLVAADRMYHLIQQATFGEISPEMQQAVTAMTRSNQNLMQMVNNMLDVYRFEAGKKTLHLEPCDLDEIAAEVVTELTPLAQEKSLTLKLHLLTLGNVIVGDRLELRRVLNNLIGNAIKFTDVGTIEVRMLPNSNQDTATIEVTDTGYGIGIEDQATIFERFRQGKNKRSGSGLGLHLSRYIVEAHGGKITLTSQVGKGSVFQVQLPKQIPHQG
jgi:two-component system sensor histidine kinase/response regulator